MKRILITGSNGLLGQKLIKNLITLREENYDVLATSQGENRMSDRKGYNYQSLDITNVNDVEAVFDSFQPDVVINTAAMTNVDVCETEKEKCRQLNVEAVMHLINASRKHNSHLIHLSTDFVFERVDHTVKQINPTHLVFMDKVNLTQNDCWRKAILNGV